jgi:hypothetical protein
MLLPGVLALAARHSPVMTAVSYCCVLFDGYAMLIDYQVPIYDAQKCDKSFYELVPDIDRLPHINCELPAGSSAVVAYMANTWGSPITVSFNIKWVMLLGVPGSRG